MTVVIGCVWGAWRTLADDLDDPPDYPWCEVVWHRVRRDPAMPPVGHKDQPGWLVGRMLAELDPDLPGALSATG